MHPFANCHAYSILVAKNIFKLAAFTENLFGTKIGIQFTKWMLSPSASATMSWKHSGTINIPWWARWNGIGQKVSSIYNNFRPTHRSHTRSNCTSASLVKVNQHKSRQNAPYLAWKRKTLIRISPQVKGPDREKTQGDTCSRNLACPSCLMNLKLISKPWFSIHFRCRQKFIAWNRKRIVAVRRVSSGD